MPRFGPYRFAYDPPITLVFDSDDHVYLREYGADLVPQPSVTTILKIIDKSEFLIPWASKRVAEKMIATMPTWEDGLDVYTKCIPLVDFYDLCDQAKKAPREILEDAGSVGEEAHKALENAIKFAISTNGGVVEKFVSPVVDPRAESCCRAALDWMLRHNVRWRCTEQKIYSKKYQFAGTMDGKALVDSCADPVCCPVRFTDALSIIDWKSSNQLQVSYVEQVAAYRYAHMEETAAPITDAFILRLGKEDGEFEPWSLKAGDLDDAFDAFLACLDLTRRHTDVKFRMAEAMKARTARKRAVRAVERESEKVAAKEAKVIAKAAAKKAKKEGL